MLTILVFAVAALALYVCGPLRSKVVLLETDAYLCHKRIASLIARVETLEHADGISYHEDVTTWRKPGSSG